MGDNQLCVGRDCRGLRRSGDTKVPEEGLETPSMGEPRAQGEKGVCAKGGAGGRKSLDIGFFVLLLHLALFLLI